MSAFCKCRTKHCRRRLNPKKNRSPYCPRCASKRFREKFPLKYAFNNLRKRARQRGKDFTLTFAEYEAFALGSGYAAMKGKSALSLSIDRVDDTRGYHADNIAAITLRENSRKQFVPRLREYIARCEAEEKKGGGAALRRRPRWRVDE